MIFQNPEEYEKSHEKIDVNISSETKRFEKYKSETQRISLRSKDYNYYNEKRDVHRINHLKKERKSIQTNVSSQIKNSDVVCKSFFN